MGTLKDSIVSSDRQKWQKIFDALVQMLETQHSKTESLLKERELLEERIHLQYDQISQMKRDSTVQEKLRVVEEAKFDLLLSMKQREAFLSNLKLGNSSTELEGFKAWFDHLSRKCAESNNVLNSLNTKDEGRRCKALESEVRRLKSENEKLVQNSEVSTLLAEKNLVWNQYNKMERERTNELRTKCAEIERANEKIQKLLEGMEQLQLSNGEKDDIIVTLKDSVAKLQADSVKKSEETDHLLKELEMLRKKSINGSATPVLRYGTGERTSRLGGKNSSTHGRNVFVKKESYPSRAPDIVKVTEKGSRSMKRTATDPVHISETPKLFSSTFKFPKLKNSSPRVT